MKRPDAPYIPDGIGPADVAVRERLRVALKGVDAADVVLAVSRAGRRTVVTGGTGPAPEPPRPILRYEVGTCSASYTVLLLTVLARQGAVRLDDPLIARLPPLRLRFPTAARAITLRHLATHTSGLPRLPAGLLPGAVLRPYASGYDRYDTARLLDAFARTRPRHRPGAYWARSGFGVALLAAALEEAVGERYPALLARHVLGPLGLTSTSTAPGPRGAVAVGHRGDGMTPVRPARVGAFAPAVGLRATPEDLLAYLEAQAGPERGPLGAAVLDAQRPQLIRGPATRRETHTLAGWLQQPGESGPLLFSSGASPGQQAFLGFHRASGTALVALSTRRGRAVGLTATAYGLLVELSGGGLPGSTPPPAGAEQGARGV
ncbi:serine hydrolase domain-containing protein [Streptomyces sp. NPDC007088]|uniref:serine hydrolase domain-containing protein n=1 Tax=Streptomyces sp. NPDC007088 TaxID=3364773 RepID=UPI0036AC1B5D